MTDTAPNVAASQAPRSHRRVSSDSARFLAQALRRPLQIGAIAPSGPHVAAQAAALIAPSGGPQIVVELGPGSGVITDALAARLPRSGRLTAVEINADLVKHLIRTRPWLNVMHGDAVDLPRLLHDAGLPAADLIVSALPWSVIPDHTQGRLLTAISDALSPRGSFATVLTLPVRPLPAARRLRRRLDTTFASVTRTRIIWRNIPPALLYVCHSPHRPLTSPDGPTRQRHDAAPAHRIAGP